MPNPLWDALKGLGGAIGGGFKKLGGLMDEDSNLDELLQNGGGLDGMGGASTAPTFPRPSARTPPFVPSAGGGGAAARPRTTVLSDAASGSGGATRPRRVYPDNALTLDRPEGDPLQDYTGDQQRARKVLSPGNRLKQGATNALWGAIAGLANSQDGDIGRGIGAGIASGIGGAINPSRGKEVLYEQIDRPRMDAIRESGMRRQAEDAELRSRKARATMDEMQPELARGDAGYRDAQRRALEIRIKYGDKEAQAELDRINAQTELDRQRRQTEIERGESEKYIPIGPRGSYNRATGATVYPGEGAAEEKPKTLSEAKAIRESAEGPELQTAYDSTIGDPEGWRKYLTPADVALAEKVKKEGDSAMPAEMNEVAAAERRARAMHLRMNEKATAAEGRRRDAETVRKSRQKKAQPPTRLGSRLNWNEE